MTTTTKPNPYLTFLLVGGISGIAIGGFIWLIAAQALDTAQFAADLGSTFAGGYYDDSGLAAPTAWMWFGIILAIVGAILLIVHMSVKAARHQ